MAETTVGAILLAAGESRRMGQLKPLLPWLGTTLISYQLAQLKAAGIAPIVVVLGHESRRVAPLLEPFSDLILVENPHYQLGKASSIQIGLRTLPDHARSLMIHAVDQPRRAETLAALVSHHREGRALITVPTYQGRRGHPPVFSSRLREELSNVSEERQGLREILLRHAADIAEVEMDTPELLYNLNSPEDYRRALDLFQTHSPSL